MLGAGVLETVEAGAVEAGAPGAAGASGASSGSSERRQMGHVACSCSHGVMQFAWKMWSHSNRDTVSPGNFIRHV